MRTRTRTTVIMQGPHRTRTPLPPGTHHRTTPHTTTCCTTLAGPGTTGRVHQASSGYNGRPNIAFWSKTTVFNDTFLAKNRPVKTDDFPDSDRKRDWFFTKMPFLTFLTFLVVFGPISEPSGFSWFFGVFHCFGGVRFSLGKSRKSAKCVKIH